MEVLLLEIVVQRAALEMILLYQVQQLLELRVLVQHSQHLVVQAVVVAAEEEPL